MHVQGRLKIYLLTEISTCIKGGFEQNFVLNQWKIQEDITVEKMDEVKIAKRDQDINITGNTYIICNFDEQQNTYVFNESRSTFKLINKLEETAFSVDFNDAFIVATRDNIELSINRVSGDAKINNDLKSGNCRLTDKRRF